MIACALGGAACGVLVDQVSKWLIFRLLAHHSEIQVASSFLVLVERRNPGGVFGVFPGSGHLFTALSVLALGLIGVLMWRWLGSEPRPALAAALAAVLAGAVGNLIDRLALGAVRDFIHISVGRYGWPTFNMADIFITVGAIALVALMLLHSPTERGKKCSHDGAAGDST